MENYNGLKLRPIFYSEISSSYLLFEIFQNHNEIATEFIKFNFNLTVDEIITINREKSYKGRGAIDIIIHCKKNNKPLFVLIEVKVHDYLSATTGQIKTYFDAALEETTSEDVYFIYLTQFNKILNEKGLITPGTIKEFEDANRDLQKYKNKLKHVSWFEFHDFLAKFNKKLTLEENKMLEFQKKWIYAEIANDILNNTIEVGERDILRDYFKDIDFDFTDKIPFGKIVNKNKRKIFVIDLSNNLCDGFYLDQIIGIIKSFSKSEFVDRKVKKNTEENVINSVKAFLINLSQDPVSWELLSFYSKLFYFVNSDDYMIIFGTGGKGFSIKVAVKNKGFISLCTLWTNRTIEFSIKR